MSNRLNKLTSNKGTSKNRATSTLPIKQNKVLMPPVFDYNVSIDNLVKATEKENVAVITNQRNEALSLDSFINYSIGFIGEANSKDSKDSQDRFIRLFLNNIGQDKYTPQTKDTKNYGTIYLRTIESNKLKILFMNSYLNPIKEAKENILDKKIKEKFIRGYIYFNSTILFIFVDDEKSRAIENLLKDCYSMGQDITIYVIHSIKEGESELKHEEMIQHYTEHEFINFTDKPDKYYWYNLKEDTNKTIVHLLYEDTHNTDNSVNLATFGYMKALFDKVNQMTPVDANDKSSSFNYTFKNYLHFFLLQLYSYSNISELQVIAEAKGFRQTVKPDKAKLKAPGLLNTNNTIRSDPGYYYEKIDGQLKITVEAWIKPKTIKGKIQNDYNQIDLTFEKDTEHRNKTFCNFPNFIGLTTFRIPTKFGLIKGFDKKYYTIKKENGKLVITYEIHDKPETSEEEEEED